MCESVPANLEGGRAMIIGCTGFIGRFVAEACLDSGLPTYLLVRPTQNSTSNKAATINFLQSKGAAIIHGCIEDQQLMEKILKEYKIEVVISAIGGQGLLDQLILVQAIKAVGTIKRFLPSEFGHDIDRVDPVEPGLSVYNEKRRVRRAVEGAGIPYTYICCNSIAAWPYHDNTHPADVLPPLDHFLIYGDGTVKAYFVAGCDIGKFTVKAMNDDRTVNKTVHFRPQGNLFDMNELASMWERKYGRILPRIVMTDDDLLTAAKASVVASFTHDIFIKGCQISYSLDKPSDVEVCSLYPETPFQSVDSCFDEFVQKILDVAKAN
ncbi:leucoanthocyanidin reductase-like isoform X2 [Humulus lupulus]|uniref:leucoanthocyanidin reductase-like isoform X2 n=1 Tax=Humulus lupulus TaxID=3486 RepID=UPI002B4032BC|nr:leucoanthocyanidin reductase-like isoform X2 [Humulus lupulus]